jgi:hypothetical protein
LEMPGTWNICWGKLQISSRAKLRESEWERERERERPCVLQVPSLLELNMIGDGHVATGFSVCPTGIWSCLVQSFLVILLFLPFAMEVFTLCHCIMGIYNSFFILQGLS